MQRIQNHVGILMCRTIVWDVSAGVELAELPPSGNWNFAAAWSPTNPGVFATASFDGKVRVSVCLRLSTGIMSLLVNTPTCHTALTRRTPGQQDRPQRRQPQEQLSQFDLAKLESKSSVTAAAG